MLNEIRLLYRKEPQGGFTLIEVLVGLLIIGLIVGGGLANYRRLNERKIVEGAAKQVEQALRDAQKRASAGVKPNVVECNNPESLISYTISMSGNSYDIQANCSGGDFSVNSYTLPEGTQFYLASTLTFSVLGHDVNHNRMVCVQDIGGDIIYTIQVDTGGAVSFGGEGACGLLNEATNKSCDTICSNMGMTCNDIGTDTYASNNRYRFRWCFLIWCFCWDGFGVCGTSMSPQGEVCDGNNTMWTYCQCQ